MRFYVSPDSIFSDKKIIHIKDKSEIHHIRDVMRLKNGAMVDIFDGKGREFSGCIEEVNKDSIVIKIQGVKSNVGEVATSPTVTLYQAIPKKNKMDFIIEKAVELGVDAVVPIVTERTVPDIKDKAWKKKERWSKIAVASSKQCGRVNLPLISDIVNFKEALLKAKDSALVIFAAIDKDAKPLKSLMKGVDPDSVSIFVGPEGDFSPKEISMAKDCGFEIASLGKLILKSDTAGAYILSCLAYEYGL
ncbi:MAG: RsmE family RNA methyltransferase [Candidatus Omnitrophota bacterium]|nr:RsmE family RNA methyltransferase [Candidatus Omnitrophota bacterium]